MSCGREQRKQFKKPFHACAPFRLIAEKERPAPDAKEEQSPPAVERKATCAQFSGQSKRQCTCLQRNKTNECEFIALESALSSNASVGSFAECLTSRYVTLDFDGVNAGVDRL
jgi:hypothetical protein